MFQQQKKKILAQYARSPRCVKSLRGRPNDQFYSWKNYLNPDIDSLYKRIIQEQKEIQNQQKLNEQRQQLSNSSKQSRESFKNYQICKVQEVIGNKNCFSKVQIGTNTPHKIYKHHRYSNSVATGESSPKVSDFRMKMSPQYSFSVITKSIESSSPQQQSVMQADLIQQRQLQIHSFTKQPLSKISKEVRFVNEQDLSQQKSKMFISETPKNDNQSELDLYHIELKQQQRLYLLHNFMAHYEKVHHKKL